MHGFIEVGELVFGGQSQVVVDPSEEKLKAEFEGVSRFYVPVYSISRIDEVEQEGPAKIKDIDGKNSNIAHFPMHMFTPNSPTTSE